MRNEKKRKRDKKDEYDYNSSSDSDSSSFSDSEPEPAPPGEHRQLDCSVRNVNYADLNRGVIGVVRNCQHYQEHTHITIFCDPLPSYQESILKMLILRTPLKIAIHYKRH